MSARTAVASGRPGGVQEDLTYIEKPTQILETANRVTRTNTIRMCKVRWITTLKKKQHGNEKRT
jgi:hypothetical protein